MPRVRKYASDTERVAAYRARHELVNFSVDLPRDVVDALAEWMRFKDFTRGQVIEKLIRSQLLRKR